MKSLRSLSIYTFVGFFGAGVNFLLMPVLSHYLTPTDYGLLALINTYVTIVIPLVSLVAYSYITVEYFHMEDQRKFASLFSSIAVIPILPTIVLFFLGYFFYDYLAGILELPADAKWWALSMFPLAAMTIYIDTISSYQIIIKDSKYYAVYNILRVLVEVGLTLFLVVYMGMGWKGRLLSWVVTSIIFTAVSFLYFYRKKLLTLDIQWKYVKASIIFGAPLIFHSLGKFVVNQSDRLFISKMVSLKEAGIYSVGYTIGTVMLIGASALANIATPFIMERLKAIDEDQERQIRRFTYICIGGLLVIFFIMNIASPFFFKYFMDIRYLQGYTYVLWVSLGYFFWGVYMLFSSYIYYYKKTKFLIWLAIINIITNLVFNYYFIEKYGGIGAAYATALSFFINLLLLLLKVFKMLPWFRFQLSDFKK